MKCVLCGEERGGWWQNHQGNDFWHCDNCSLVSRRLSDRLTRVDEKERYRHHQNSISNKGYVDFLQQAISPALQIIEKKEIEVLDFGCGPAPVLAEILHNQGYNVDIYDPFFFPLKPWLVNSVDKKSYDLIFSTEVFEHLSNPKKELDLLVNLLSPGGRLVVMTAFYNDYEYFQNWSYPHDQTHIIFFHNQTMEYIAQKWNLEIVYDDQKRVIIFRKIGYNK